MQLVVGGVLLSVMALACVSAVMISPYDSYELLPAMRLRPPSLAHPLGTDMLGRDMLARMGEGGLVAAAMVSGSCAIALGVGVPLGSLSGFYTGWFDRLMARLVDGWIALPGMLVALIIVARLGSSLTNLILALGFIGVPIVYRVVRVASMSSRSSAYVEAAIALGASDARVMWRHVFPNVLPLLAVVATMQMGVALLAGSSLSFIGLGVQPPQPEWGAMLAASRAYFDPAWWLMLFPGLAVTLSVMGLNYLGDGLRELFDPLRHAVSSIEGDDD